MEVLPVALAGLNRAEGRLDQAAGRIAAWGTPAGDTVDLSAEMINLLQARTEFEANAKVVNIADEMRRRLLDVLG